MTEWQGSIVCGLLGAILGALIGINVGVHEIVKALTGPK